MRVTRLGLLGLLLAGLAGSGVYAQEGEDGVRELPPHVSPATVRAIDRGVAWLAKNQLRDGSFGEAGGGGGYGVYPTAMSALAGMAFLGHGDTPSRGRYSEKVRRIMTFLLDPRHASRTGLITASGEESRSMYGHGFGTMFLACCLGEELDGATETRVRQVLGRAVELIGKSQSGAGGWLYTPDSQGDEGSVTVTQVQALRACRNAGISVPLTVIRRAVSYIEKSQNQDGGIAYNAMGGPSRPALAAAGAAVLYNAGQYDSPAARKCLQFCKRTIKITDRNGHWYYTHLYLAQAYWQVGGDDWGRYYPQVRDFLLRSQASDGSWQGDGVGKVYGTSIAVTILSLPFERVPLYMR
ncbi:MAG: terpene cyclase/mutase family protein [Planctomycetes bacterium]|nr:terpene cyclase/mutase family protein [Planctomycetota bacterium]